MATNLLSSVVLVLCVLSVTCNSAAGASRKSNVSHQELEIENHLKQLNKPPVKSIKSPDGDIIDCVLIEQQPAFDHPCLKNHKIQLRPNYYPEGVSVPNKVGTKGSKQITQLWQQNGECPEGTIPIRRIKKEDLLRGSSTATFGRKKHKSVSQLSAAVSHGQINYDGQYVTALVQADKLYGAKARINVWNPKVQKPSEFSLSQIWIAGGSVDNLNTIEVGWQVYPYLYGDNRTRFFIYWTSDHYKNTGCYNLLCSGFIQLYNKVAVGAPIKYTGCICTCGIS